MSANVKIEDIYLGDERAVWFVATRVTAVVVLALVGLLGNGLVLIIYRRDKKQSGAIYITALAVIDLFTCMTIIKEQTTVSQPFSFLRMRVCLKGRKTAMT